MSIEEKQYARIRRTWDKLLGPDYELTYTQWHTDVAESALERIQFLKKAFPNLSLVKVIAHGIIIDDSKRDDVIKVVTKGNKIVCSDHTEMASIYIQYACLHPEFSP